MSGDKNLHSVDIACSKSSQIITKEVFDKRVARIKEKLEARIEKMEELYKQILAEAEKSFAGGLDEVEKRFKILLRRAEKRFNGQSTNVEVEFKKIKTRLLKSEKDLDVAISFFDRDIMYSRKRLDRLEKKFNLPPLPRN